MSNPTNVAEVREYFKEELANERFVIDKSGVKTIELIGASFVADEPTIFGKVNEEYVARELEWYKSQSLNVNDIPGGPPEIWKQVADSDGFINSNYGFCIWSHDNWDQYHNVLKELKYRNLHSRRAEMIYNRPSMWEDYNRNGRSDFMCTNAVIYEVRDGVMDAVVQMRSNDAIFGYKNDYAWQRYVLEKLADEVGTKVGRIIWQAASLHIYERHFKLVK